MNVSYLPNAVTLQLFVLRQLFYLCDFFLLYVISNPFKINASCDEVYKVRVSFIFKNYVIVKNIFMDTRADIAYISHIDSQHCV